METYANQRIIDINKQSYSDNLDMTAKENLYATINLQAIETALMCLTPNAFKLWVYFAKNKHNFTIILSRVQLLKMCNMSDTTYRKAFNELLDKYYLVLREGSKTHYDFYTTPQETAENIYITIN